MIDVSDLIGIPFLEYGRTLKGLDCYGLAIEVYKRYGKTLEDVTPKAILTIKDDEYLYLPQLNIKETKKLKEAVLLEFYTKENYLHVGVALDTKTFIHCTQNAGVKISSFNSVKSFMTLSKMYEVI